MARAGGFSSDLQQAHTWRLDRLRLNQRKRAGKSIYSGEIQRDLGADAANFPRSGTILRRSTWRRRLDYALSTKLEIRTDDAGVAVAGDGVVHVVLLVSGSRRGVCAIFSDILPSNSCGF